MMMKPLKKLFRRNKSFKGAQKSHVASTTESESCDGQARIQESPQETPNELMVRTFADLMNAHDLKGIKELMADHVKLFLPKAEIEMDWDIFAGEVQNIFDSFPDFSFRSESIKEQSDGVVVWSKMIPNGHHTGKPYAFGPCPPIESSGKYVENSPETIYFHFENGLIVKQIITNEGEMSGPPGIYTQLGGFPLM